MNMLLQHKRNIARKFNRAVHSYDAAADLQCAVGHELINKLVTLQLSPNRLLDLGVGTGQLAELLQSCYSDCKIIGLDFAERMLLHAADRLGNNSAFVCADFEALPFQGDCFDLIFSNMSLQWSFVLQQTLQDIMRCLRKTGVLALTLLVDDTLHELSHSYKKLFGVDRVNVCYSHQVVLSAVKNTGATIIWQKVTSYQKNFSCLTQLLQFLQQTGASYSSLPRTSIRPNKSTWHALQKCYAEHFAFSGNLPATFTVLTLLASKHDV
jgi:malonyl-CoA O-methyltransferase